MNEADGQLQVAYIILGYKPISLRFQAPKCVIKANDPRLHHNSVAYEGFIVLEGIPIPKGTPFTQPLFVGIPSVGVSPSQPIVKEEEEKEEEEEKKRNQRRLWICQTPKTNLKYSTDLYLLRVPWLTLSINKK